jgi:hypothetical protein
MIITKGMKENQQGDRNAAVVHDRTAAPPATPVLGRAEIAGLRGGMERWDDRPGIARKEIMEIDRRRVGHLTLSPATDLPLTCRRASQCDSYRIHPLWKAFLARFNPTRSLIPFLHWLASFWRSRSGTMFA